MSKKRTPIFCTEEGLDGDIASFVFDDVSDYLAFLEKYSAGIRKELEFIPLKVAGKTYAEKKADAQDRAIAFSNAELGYLSLMELNTLQNFFEAVGRRYGLLREFRENAIC